VARLALVLRPIRLPVAEGYVEVHSDDRMPEYPERDFSSWPLAGTQGAAFKRPLTGAELTQPTRRAEVCY
jgi:hypothetical protein